jgi:hypothetical protein
MCEASQLERRHVPAGILFRPEDMGSPKTRRSTLAAISWVAAEVHKDGSDDSNIAIWYETLHDRFPNGLGFKRTESNGSLFEYRTSKSETVAA